MAISLEKREEKVKIILKKRGINEIPCQVKLAIDRSGSMDDLYRDHTVQDVVERVLAIGMQVDKDKTIDVWAFHNSGIELPPVTAKNISGFVDKEIVRKISAGGTSYGPVMEQIVESCFPLQNPAQAAAKKAKSFLGGLFGKKEEAPAVTEAAGFLPVEGDPALAIFITDGENDDRGAAERAIVSSQSKDIYWMLIGIGHGHFNFIEELGDKYPNCGYFQIPDIKKIDDEDLYEAIICDEFAEWVKNFS